MHSIENNAPVAGTVRPQAGDRIVHRVAAEDRKFAVEAGADDLHELATKGALATQDRAVGLHHGGFAARCRAQAGGQTGDTGQNLAAVEELDPAAWRQEVAAWREEFAGQREGLRACAVECRQL